MAQRDIPLSSFRVIWGVTTRPALSWLHKLRKSIKLARDEGALQGDVELDGAYFGGHVRPENRKEDRKDRRKAENQTGKRQVVVVAASAKAAR